MNLAIAYNRSREEADANEPNRQRSGMTEPERLEADDADDEEFDEDSEELDEDEEDAEQDEENAAPDPTNISS